MQKEFLQSEEWQKFQEAFGRRTFSISHPYSSPLSQAGEVDYDFSVSIIEHSLPIVGKYFYVPRGPVVEINSELNTRMTELLDLAEKKKAGWVRIDPADEKMLSHLTLALSSGRRGMYKIVKAPHDMQPKQLFVIDISGTEEEILARMKSKARYNVRLAEKKNIQIKTGKEYLEDFLRLTKVMAKRQGITPHPDEYYKKMLEIIPENILKLYVAEYEGKIIATNIMIFYGDMAIYLHGSSDDEYRNVMAPYLLQWRAIQDAKKAGCTRYDFGGIKTTSHQPSPSKGEGEKEPSPLEGEGARRADEVGNWAGITRFKLGFSPETKPTEFPGSYDIIINSRKYWLYRFIQKVKSIL